MADPAALPTGGTAVPTGPVAARVTPLQAGELLRSRPSAWTPRPGADRWQVRLLTGLDRRDCRPLSDTKGGTELTAAVGGPADHRHGPVDPATTSARCRLRRYGGRRNRPTGSRCTRSATAQKYATFKWSREQRAWARRSAGGSGPRCIGPSSAGTTGAFNTATGWRSRDPRAFNGSPGSLRQGKWTTRRPPSRSARRCRAK